MSKFCLSYQLYSRYRKKYGMTPTFSCRLFGFPLLLYWVVVIIIISAGWIEEKYQELTEIHEDC